MKGLLMLLAYLVGSIPFSDLAGRLRGVNLREHGSGNLGATNAIRILGPGVGIPVLGLDVLKGVVATTLIPAVVEGGVAPDTRVLCAAAAVAGHVWPVFARFRGGKGVATAGGAFLGLAPVATGIATGAFVVVVLLSRYVSVASMVAAVVLAASLIRLGAAAPVMAGGLAVAALVIVRHRENVRRLATGTENRVSFRRRKGDGS
ncbi:MAG: glycerol-3-phosphate 1-O-acyltransferase PlsY [Gemmatimonadota bacterium]|jgi:glycerol-3-phosphate acyltransferase PlsY|nr:glycerol-3-phosphate 1-O-acyltransferase PlsY [Gemmatimonadota bacterium]